LAQLPHFPQQLNFRQVLVRFFVRLIILSSFAAFGSIGFTGSFVALLWMAIILCAVVGFMRREPVLHVLEPLGRGDCLYRALRAGERVQSAFVLLNHHLYRLYEIATVSPSNSYLAAMILAA